MEGAKWLFRKFRFLILIVFTILISGMSCREKVYAENRNAAVKTEQWEKGYDLPIDEEAGKRAEKECKEAMEMIAEIYQSADKGSASNVVISDETMFEMKTAITETGCPVTSSENYATMENYKKMDSFLHSCIKGQRGSVVMYKVSSNGGIRRMEYIFDGTDIYLLSAGADWNQKNLPGLTYVSFTRIKEWKYTDKGWFCYELCVPEYPEVTEMVDGSNMFRVKPLSDRYRKLSRQFVFPLGYQGNNLLCSNWNTENLKDLDYNGMYEYLYRMKYEEPFNAEDYPNGIPAEQFESLIMEYLPVTQEEIREWAVFDEEHESYIWVRLRCRNYSPTYFGTSLPEVVNEKKNADGTITLTVDAVCARGICDDAVITHELTIRFTEDGGFQYLGNKILNDGIQDIPQYQYRLGISSVLKGNRG